jgi:transaldolase
MNEATFRRMHEEDKMAKDKLAEGIDGFSKALVALEKLLGDKLAALPAK